MNSLDNFYRGKKVLLTGHTGFIGSWLSFWLIDAGAGLTGVALPPKTTPNLFDQLSLEKAMRSIVADIRCRSEMEKIFGNTDPEIVIHNAAQPLVLRSYEYPVETFETNIVGTANVLEAARKCSSVRAIVVVTTDKCYQNREWEYGYRESDRLGGHDPYSASKAAAEIVTHAYRESFFNAMGVAVATVRAGNVIGGGDWAANRIVPDIVRALCNGGVVKLRNPESTRPWQHVLEPLRGYLMLGQRLWEEGGAWASAWNFGPADMTAVNVEALARKAVGRWGSGIIEMASRPGPAHEADMLKLDCSKAHDRLGWIPILSLDETIQLTMDWYQMVSKGECAAADITREQLSRYRKRASLAAAASAEYTGSC